MSTEAKAATADFKKVCRVGTRLQYEGGRPMDVFVGIEYQQGKLSISGVEGPLKSGDAKGGCGQIDMHYKHRNPKDDDERSASYNVGPEAFTFAPGWDAEKWFDLLDVWKKWHLNDMQAGCEHQRASWDTKRKVEIVSYGLTSDAYQLRNASSTRAARYAATGQVSDLNETEKALVLLDKWFTHLHEPPDADSPLSGCYEVKKREEQALGWLSQAEHPEGMLSRPCEVCGYKYGTKWLRVEVPQEVVEFLRGLPDTDIAPAWI